jgi:hypothetical protein
MSTDQSLTLWNTRWTLVAGVVVCGECLQGQRLSRSREPFEHEAGCRHAEEAGSWPWAELHDVLDAARG